MKIRLLILVVISATFSNIYSREPGKSITLPGGRILGYAGYGDDTGYPVYYFHGGQESRLSSMFMDLFLH